MIASVACVIPAYDAAATLGAVVAGVRAAVPHARIIVVNDGSGDGTGEAASGSDVVIDFERNCGKGAALRAGFAEALRHGVSAVLTLDADGQHDPAHGPALLAALEHADLVIGSRALLGTAMPVGRRLTNVLASAAVGAITGAPIRDAQSGFRAVRRPVLERVRAVGARYEYETDFLIQAARAGFRIAAVPIATTYGAPSHFRRWRDSMRVVRTIWRHRAGAFR